MAIRTGSELADEASRQIGKLQSGNIVPISTGTDHLDEALMGGLLPGTVLSLCGFSFHGKSYELEKINRHINKAHPETIILNCNWELETFKIISRDLSYRLKKSVKDVLFNKPSESETPTFAQVFSEYRKPNLYFQPEPTASEEFEMDVNYLIDNFKDKPIVVYIDNLENVLIDRGSQKECMDRILYKVNVLKKSHPFISFIILNQLNSDIIDRIHNPKGHMPVQKDVYGTQQLFKLSDVVQIKVMPYRLGITEKYMVFGKGSHSHLSEFKLPGKGKVESFDPFGTVFFFYLKARESSKDFRTIYAERMFTREEVGEPPLSMIEDAPTFDSPPKIEVPLMPVNFDTKAIKAARNSKASPF